MGADFPVRIYHRAQCSTSRQVVARVLAAGHRPEIVDYVSKGWDLAQLKALASSLQVRARDMLRVKGTQAEELRLTDEGLEDDVLFQAMIKDPILVERPIVVTPRGVRICRPVTVVDEIL